MDPPPVTEAAAVFSEAPPESIARRVESRGEGRLWTESTRDGETVLAAFRHSFPTEEKVEVGAATTAKLLECQTVVLGRGVGRQKDGFSGKGTWTATKWAFDEGDEIFVNWSTEEKRGELAEKDDAYRAGLQAAFAALAGR